MPSTSSSPRQQASSPPPSRSLSQSPLPQDFLTLRALVSTKDAGVIIGKGGKNVAELRDQTGVKAGVSKVIPGVHERVLTITGVVKSVAFAIVLALRQLVAANPPPTSIVSSPSSSLRLLVPHSLMGSIIGRGGNTIKTIQDNSGARMVASKEMLPQSTERIVEVQGSPDAIGRAVEDIGKCLLEDSDRSIGTVYFLPGSVDDRGTGNRRSGGFSSPQYAATRRSNGDNGNRGRVSPSGSPVHSPISSQPPANLRTQNISIPSDMVGCIIGRNGTKITEIRRLSGSKISIAKAPHDETGERMFTIVGTPEANEKALFLLYNQLESEKERRVGREAQQQSDMQQE